MRKTVHNPHKVVDFFGLKLKKHHVGLAGLVALGMIYVGDVHHHHLTSTTGEALLLPVVDRFLRFFD